MVIRDVIKVKDDRLLDGLTPVVRMMSRVEESNKDEVVIDFSET